MIFSTFSQRSMRGFTLVELLVASSIFSVVVIIATGALFSAQNVNTRLQQTHIILDGINLSLESIVRDIRYGAVFHCGQTYNETDFEKRKSCPLNLAPLSVPGKALVFRSARSVSPYDREAYYIEEGSIYKNVCVAAGSTCTWGTPLQITGSDVVVDTLSFFVSGAHTSTGGSNDVGGDTDSTQPIITIVIGGITVATGKAQQVKFRVQSTATTRSLDN